jgi:hypothetical protein
MTPRQWKQVTGRWDQNHFDSSPSSEDGINLIGMHYIAGIEIKVSMG